MKNFKKPAELLPKKMEDPLNMSITDFFSYDAIPSYEKGMVTRILEACEDLIGFGGTITVRQLISIPESTFATHTRKKTFMYAKSKLSAQSLSFRVG